MPEAIKYSINGTVYDEHNSPLNKAQVKIYEVDLRRETLLGTVATDASGHYTFSYTTQPTDIEYKSPDICIKIIRSGATKISGTSPVYFNIQPETTIHYRLGDAAVTDINEFDRLVALLTPLLTESKLRFDQLEETDKNKDISFLSGETGEDPAAINALTQAHRLFIESKITTEILYALLRLGFPPALSAILDMQSDSIRKAVEQAVNDNIISSAFLEKIPAAVAGLNSLALNQVEEGKSEKILQFKALAGAILKEAKDQKTFFQTWYDNEYQPEKFWDELKKQPGFKTGDLFDNTQRIFELNTLTAGQPELANTLYKKLTTGNKTKDISTLAALSAADWEKEITTAKVKNFPSGIAGENDKEKTTHYAASLESLFRELYPTAFFADRLKADKTSAFTNKADLDKFFAKNPSFDLAGSGITKALEAADLTGITKKEEVKAAVKTISRLQKLAGNNYAAVNALQGKGLHSAGLIVNRYGRQGFAKEFAAVLGGENAATAAYQKAASVSNRTMALLVSYKSAYDVPLAVTHNRIADPENEGKRLYKMPPGYHDMFSDGELCDCEHCQSVYSPAAYFVDMLRSIRKEGETDAEGNSTVYKKLLERRPDLEHIHLTCENTNTALPYIDLVNELLEKQVLSNVLTGTALRALQNQSFQTTLAADILQAFPEHNHTEAYTHIKTITAALAFSDKLPFDEPLEQVKLYTEKLGWNRHALAAMFSGIDPVAKYSNAGPAKAWFGASGSAWQAVSENNDWEIPVPGGGRLSEVLSLMKLTYTELLQLLETRFLNPLKADGTRTLSTVQAAEDELLTCNLNKLFVKGITATWLKKAARFIRLWKIADWELFDLDRAFTAFELKEFPATDDFDEKVLIPLYQTDLLKQRFRITRSQALALLKNIDEYTYRDHRKEGQPVMASLYQSLFQNPMLSDPGTTNPAEKIAAALETSVSEITNLDIPLADADIPALSMVYRNILLSKKLGLPVAELKTLFEITGSSLTITGEWDAPGILQLADEAVIVNASGLPPARFYEFLQSRTGDPHAYEISEEFIAFINGQITEFESITAIEDITERNEQTLTKIEELINLFPENIHWMDDKTAKSNDDKTLKRLIDDFTGSNNHILLKTLSAAELISKLEELLAVCEAHMNDELLPVVFKQFGFDDEKIRWLRQNREPMGISALWNPDITAATPGIYEAYRKLFFLSRLNKVAALSNEKDWTALFDMVINPGEETDPEDLQTHMFKLLTELYGISDQLWNQAAAKLGLEFPGDHPDAANIIALINATAAIHTTGASPEQLDALLHDEPDGTMATTVRNLLKSKYSIEDWLKTITPISDAMRGKRRDALVAWLITQNPDWNKPEDIYKYLLIDPEMDACMDSSRLKQAISSVQLYIDRCLMGLETGISLSDDFAKQWNEWRKQYRVWEANRKIFLYPENWIEPELRDDKSPFFEELESQLKQNEVTEETAKEALLTYLQKLDTIAKLETVGLFNDEETGTLHVFGRTHNLPHQYFYRTQYKNIWSSWEKVELDIEGDHILPVVWNGRLMLFWGQFTEKQKSNSGNTKIEGNLGSNASLTMSSPEPEIYYEMKLAWSEYKNGRWGGKKISKDVCEVKKVPELFFNSVVAKKNIVDATDGETAQPTNPNHNINNVSEIQVTPRSALSISQISLSSSYFNGKLFIRIHQWDERLKFKLFFIGKFEFDGCNSAPAFDDKNSYQINTLYSIHEHVNNHFTTKAGIPFTLNGYHYFWLAQRPVGVPVLNKINLNSSLTISRHQLDQYHIPDLMFENQSHIFHIKGIPNLKDSILSWTDGISQEMGYAESVNNMNLKTTNVVNTDLSYWSMPSVQIPLFQRKYILQSFYHPYICPFIKSIREDGISSVYTKEIQIKDPVVLFTDTQYNPAPLVKQPYPVAGLEYTIYGAYSLYNWELFFHIPLTIASQLMQNQQFEDARKWLHYIFNPTVAGNEAEGTKRFWITQPFREEAGNPVNIEALLQDEAYAEELATQLDHWEDHPFNPHAVARFRVSAYMRKTVLLYIDNLIKWGDQLFGKDTIESINEATLLYVLAGEILGDKVQTIPQRIKPATRSFTDIKNDLDAFSNAATEIETYIPSGNSESDHLRIFYFCLPKNDHLLKYWDTIEDRLYKIRHCMNISGQVRSLALFEPPIDPAMLVRAAAAGLTISEVLDTPVSLPHYRFQVMLQKANELCSDVKNLGSQLLSVIEKKDAEGLALLRSTHELNMLGVIKRMKELQRDEAKESLNSLNESRKVIEERYSFYQTREYRNSPEENYWSMNLSASRIQEGLAVENMLTSILYAISDFKIGSGFTIGATYGGSNLGKASAAAIQSAQSTVSFLKTEAELSNIKGSYDRRMDDWQFHARSAELELRQIDKQIAAAEIRLAIAEQDIENHTLQTEQSREADDYMRGKFSNKDLYNWMLGQLSTVYFQSYKLAYSTAKKSEKCMQHELAVENTSYIQFGYWTSLKQGLLSGERLQLDLRLLENAYMEQNTREMEITKHISLTQLSGDTVETLKTSGACTFDLPELIFDRDFAGHYRRRIKSVSISIPCIAGPYTSISATLTLVSSKYRKDISNADSYAEQPDDPRFVKSFGNSFKSIATSHAQNDSGMFELNFRDERYLPFEGCGAISSWKLELPVIAVKQFDYNTISDVIVHIRYSAKDGGLSFKEAVNSTLIG